MIQILANKSDDRGMGLKVMIGYAYESNDSGMCLKVMIGICA